MISSAFRQFGTFWKGLLWLVIQNFYIYHEFELKTFWLGDNYTAKHFTSLLLQTETQKEISRNISFLG